MFFYEIYVLLRNTYITRVQGVLPQDEGGLLALPRRVPPVSVSIGVDAVSALVVELEDHPKTTPQVPHHTLQR